MKALAWVGSVAHLCRRPADAGVDSVLNSAAELARALEVLRKCELRSEGIRRP